METFKFTKAVIAELPPALQGKRAEYADTVVNGLRLRITAGGVKSFCVIRKHDGKFIRVTLGRFPDLPIEQARTLALQAIGSVATNRKNPNERRRAGEK